MELLHAILLALVQGVTEFLPISSSAHLILAPVLLGWPDQGLAFDVAVHVGTLVAVVGYFRHEVIDVGRGSLQRLRGGPETDASRLGTAIVLATIPVGLVGLSAGGLIEDHLRNPLIIAATSIGFGLLLLLADRSRGERGTDQISWQDALLVGLAQAVALIPGTSRSGITMTAALLLGLSREAAARLSFLMAIPVIVLAGLLQAGKLLQHPAEVDWLALGVGTSAAAISAYACIHLFLVAINRMGFMPFVIYRVVLGLVLIVIFA